MDTAEHNTNALVIVSYLQSAPSNPALVGDELTVCAPEQHRFRRLRILRTPLPAFGTLRPRRP